MRAEEPKIDRKKAEGKPCSAHPETAYPNPLPQTKFAAALLHPASGRKLAGPDLGGIMKSRPPRHQATIFFPRCLPLEDKWALNACGDSHLAILIGVLAAILGVDSNLRWNFATGHGTFATAAQAQPSISAQPLADPPHWHGSSPVISQEVLTRQEQRIRIIEQVSPTVVALFSTHGDGGGSGVIISPDGFALTNFHVAKPCGIALKAGLSDGRVYDAITVGWDPVGDIALIKLVGRDDFPCVQWGDSDRLTVGDEVLVMGNPFMLATDLQPTVTWGILSGLRRYQHPAGTMLEYADCLQTDASINPGNSGGPMFDLGGRLIGINGRASFDRRGRVNVGVGYAVPVHQIRNFLAHLHGGRIVDHATVSFRIATDVEGRPVVSDILEGSDAWRRGVRRDDELLSFAGRMITNPNDFKNVLANFPPGWQVPAVFRRGQQQYQVMLRLEPLHSEAELLKRLDALPLQPFPPRGEDWPESLAEASPEVSIPEELRPYYEPRRGFANFHFNRLHQRRVWSVCSQKAGLPIAGSSWRIRGKWDARESFSLELTPVGCRLELGGQNHQWIPEESTAAEVLMPPDIRGLLAGLFMWYRLSTEGPAVFSDFFYWGALPYRGEKLLVDVLEATFGVARTRWLVYDGLILAVELDLHAGEDPWEFHLEAFHPQTIRGKMALMPKVVIIQVGEQRLADLRITELQVE